MIAGPEPTSSEVSDMTSATLQTEEVRFRHNDKFHYNYFGWLIGGLFECYSDHANMDLRKKAPVSI